MIYLVTTLQSLFNSGQYEIISPEKAISMLKKEPLLGGDTETEGLNPFNKKLLTIQLGTEEFQVVWDCTTVSPKPLKEILENKNIKTIWWNALFDLKFLYHIRIIPENIYDGMLAEKLLWLGYPPGMHSISLKAAGQTYCGVELDKSVRGKIVQVGLTPEVIVYSAFDVKYEIPIYYAQQKLLKEKGLLRAIDLENEFVKVLAYIEYCGVKLDVKKWKAKMDKDKEKADTYKTQLDNWVVKYFTENSLSDRNYIEKKYLLATKGDYGYKDFDPEIPKEAIFLREERVKSGDVYIYGVYKIPFNFVYRNLQGDLFSGFDSGYKCNVNWDSPKQVIPLLELLGFKLDTFDKVTKKKKKSVESNIIEAQLDVSPIAEIYLNYKAAQKVVSTYGENFLKAITKEDGRIHPSFFQLQDTGRLSSGGGESGINIQNLPSDAETRACFVAEKGNKWISCDYQSQESRLIASIANDPAMIELFEHGCGDVHSLVAYMSYPNIIPRDTKIEDIKKLYHDARQNAKGIEFAINLLI